jgi:hypothetical protein
MACNHLRWAAAAAWCALFLLCICGKAVAFNPQPEPPGHWRIEGFADLLAMDMNMTDTQPPFGLSSMIVGDDMVDFSAGIVAMFDAPDNDGDTLPDDGIYAMDLQYFRVQIGDTSWDEMMPGSDMMLQVQGGAVIGIQMTLTPTVVEHPDLSFMLPASPGTWSALDERNGINLGTVSGTYSLRDGVVPEPATMSLFGLGLVALAAWRWRCRR